jgi:hypothetical protein
MNLLDPAPSQPAERKFQFSLGTLLLLVAIICLGITNAMTYREMTQLRGNLITKSPLPVQEVARQFKESTTLGPIKVSVKDVRYSAKDDSYKVDFSWIDATTGNTWHTDLTLTADGYGAYYGTIRNEPFIAPLGYKDGFAVAVKSPSPLAH